MRNSGTNAMPVPSASIERANRSLRRRPLLVAARTLMSPPERGGPRSAARGPRGSWPRGSSCDRRLRRDHVVLGAGVAALVAPAVDEHAREAVDEEGQHEE